MTVTQRDAAAPAPRSRMRLWVAGAAALGALVSTTALSGAFAPQAAPEETARPATIAASATPTSTPEASPSPSPTTQAVAPKPRAAAPERLIVESAGIDVAVLPLTPSSADEASQSLVPPFTLDGYWLTSFGMPGRGSNDTTYITGHSWEDREAPFNRLSTDVEVGHEIVLHTGSGVQHYVVDSIVTHDKDTLKDSNIWDITPNRLVLISCYTEDPWGKNVVVTASPKDSP
ncbi:class F sortase [Arthrobacter sp. Soil782]|uniref:class F sortase n=1 Tax=Arthrobacter sp. Soil782 TaxID=1736410 RepID=UPI0009E71478|nr:class F sortase [Arthrobacter sp. Soil782]